MKEEWVLSKNLSSFITDQIEMSPNKAAKMCNLFENGCEVAYVARYRGDVHGGLSCEQVRKAFESYNDALDLNKKAKKALDTVPLKIVNMEEKSAVRDMIKNCGDVYEVAEISKMYSSGGRKTKASIARELGFEQVGRSIIDGKFINLNKFINNQLDYYEKVEEQVIISLADLINKREDTLNIINKLSKLEVDNIKLHVVSSLTKKATKSASDPKVKSSLEHFKEYLNFNRLANRVAENQILALDRAEQNELINWKVEFSVKEAKHVHPCKYIRVDHRLTDVFKKACDYSIRKLFIPKVQRAAKRFLLKKAEDAAIKCFSKNVSQLFSLDGIRSVYVIALDPGFSAIKSAFLKPNGDVIATDEFRFQGKEWFDKKGVELLKGWATLSSGYDVVFAIGNGKGSYETQSAVSKMIDQNCFPNNIDVSFCVVPEDGASKYSVSESAKLEFPDEKCLTISAISIGRRLIDPMGEYVKIEPKHLGKGMYQHSVNSTRLSEALEQVVRECVSLRGTDVNYASEYILRQVCGLNKKTAKGIVEYRKLNGYIKNRMELQKVPGLGKAAFIQCAGFLTISPQANQSLIDDSEPIKKKRKMSKKLEEVETNPLDNTSVHPDMYDVAERLLKMANISLKDVSNYEKIEDGLLKLRSCKLESEECIALDILLCKPHIIPPPPRLKTVRKMVSLKEGERVTGIVRNQTSFGIFVDIGVEQDGLIHISAFNRNECLPEVGTVLNCRIQSIDNQRRRIGLIGA